jgi:hypothetical protein
MKAESSAQRAEESIVAAAKAGRDLGAALDSAGALVKGVKESVEAGAQERTRLEAASVAARSAQAAVVASIKAGHAKLKC